MVYNKMYIFELFTLQLETMCNRPGRGSSGRDTRERKPSIKRPAAACRSNLMLMHMSPKGGVWEKALTP